MTAEDRISSSIGKNAGGIDWRRFGRTLLEFHRILLVVATLFIGVVIAAALPSSAVQASIERARSAAPVGSARGDGDSAMPSRRNAGTADASIQVATSAANLSRVEKEAHHDIASLR